MSEETKEVVVKKTALQEKVGKLEEQLAQLKAKVQSVHAKNLELIAQIKAKSISAKDKVLGFKPLAKLKEVFAKKEVVKIKRIIFYEIGGEVGYIRAYMKYTKGGFFALGEAELIDFVDDMEPIVLRQIGNAVICRENVVMWY
jgi:hypothetical protein